MLAGGAGRRIAGDKAVVELAGRPLVTYPVAALRLVCDEVVVVAKRDTVLPPPSGESAVWAEPDEPRHPLAGVRHALRTAGQRNVLVLACDMPCVPEALLRALVEAATGAGAVARAGGIVQPLCACYTPLALPGLMHFDPTARATDVIEALGVAHVDWEDEDALLSVNAPEDLLRAHHVLLSRT
ncbi:MAG: molybdenum cofactor guanylyltransferase [Solirubrobacteraceae bacterium]|nr:molybdenum cofactor guanylyltransferase [Solirubrobacteraceae bacterium]